jgi:hypothetical protein
MNDEGGLDGDETPVANEQAGQAAWSASLGVREFAKAHRAICGLIIVFLPVVAGWHQVEEKRTRALAKVLGIDPAELAP